MLARIDRVSDKADKIICVQCLSLMAKSVGSKLGQFVPLIIPLLQTEMKKVRADQSSDIDNELSEAC